MGVTIAGIAGMSLAVSTIVAVKPGTTVPLAGYDFTLESLHNETGSNYNARVADIAVSRDGKVLYTMHPSRRAFTTQRTTTTDAAINTNGFADVYTVLGEEHDGEAVLRLHYNPLAPWIWFGALVMAVGGGLSLADRRLRVGAPARRTLAVPA
jgi:cytochrome c-type biogenesis protein CcmF